MGFSRQESWRGLPCPPLEDLPIPGIEPTFLRSPTLAGRFFTTSAIWEALDKGLVSRVWGSSGGSAGKESACHMGDLDSIPGLRRSPGGGHGNPFQYACLGNPHGQRHLVGYSPWGHKESDTTEPLSIHTHIQNM